MGYNVKLNKYLMNGGGSHLDGNPYPYNQKKIEFRL